MSIFPIWYCNSSASHRLIIENKVLEQQVYDYIKLYAENWLNAWPLKPVRSSVRTLMVSCREIDKTAIFSQLETSVLLTHIFFASKHLKEAIFNITLK